MAHLVPLWCLWQTPQDLIDEGLYKTIAVALHPMPHRSVSLALVAQACGALPRKTRKRTLKQMASRTLKTAVRRSQDGESARKANLNKHKAANRKRQQDELARYEREEDLALQEESTLTPRPATVALPSETMV